MSWIRNREIRVAATGLACMYLFGLIERAISVSETIPHVYGDAAGMLGVLCVGIAGYVVLQRLDIERGLRSLLYFAWLLFFIYTLSDFLDEFPAIFPPENPLLGKRQYLHRILEVLFWSTGLTIVILGLFAVAIEGSVARRDARFQRARGEDATRETQRTQEQLALFHHAIEQARDAVVIIGLDDHILFANEAFHTLLGIPEGSSIGTRAAALNTSVGVQHEEMIQTTRQQGSWKGQVEARRSDGTPIHVDARLTVFLDGAGNPAGIVGIARDVTEERRVAAALAESEERHRLLAEHATDIISTHTRDGHWVYVSPSVRTILGYAPEELLGETAYDLMEPQVAAMFDAREPADFVSDNPAPIRIRVRHKQGHYVELETILRTITPYDHVDNARILSIARDMTPRQRMEDERRQLEQKLQRAQRHESLSLLAGGVAHDFNNLLLIVLASCDLLMLELDEMAQQVRPSAHNHVRQIQIAAERAADLTRQMLKYAGQGDVAIHAVNLGVLVEEMASLLEATVPKRIRIERTQPKADAVLMGDGVELRQVVLNLITNAAEAIGQRDGTIHVQTGVEACGREYLDTCVTHDVLPAGLYAFIEVADDGCGMDAATRDRMFDPFFTTKFQGRGLGLAAVMGIVRRHRGTMHIQTRPGGGTTIRVLFPLEARALRAE